MEKLCDITDCSGCEACANACSHDAITMTEDAMGHLHPQFNETKCIDCGLCTKVCPALAPVTQVSPLRAFAVASDDAEERRTSSSGGAASVAARHILKHGGVVYGCAQADYCHIGHVRIDSVEELGRLKGSKYVQSRMGHVYRQVRADLLADRPVLFTGTPCQVAGLRNFLRKDYDNLVTIDLICHGVPSQQMLRRDVAAATRGLENRKDILVNFRWKCQYGIQYGIQFGNPNGTDMHILRELRYPHDPYITAFMTGLSFRESCHRCPYAGQKRTGDLTIGDFWGLGAYAPTSFKIREGVSLVLVNTPAGERLWDKLDPMLSVEERSLQEAIAGNANLRTTSPRPPRKDLFKHVYQTTGDLNKAVRAALPRSQRAKICLTESLKRNRLIIFTFKKVRLLIHQLRHHEQA